MTMTVLELLVGAGIFLGVTALIVYFSPERPPRF